MDGGTMSYLELFLEETSFYNRLILGSILPHSALEQLPHFFQTWLRNYIASVSMYFFFGFLWSFCIYYWKRNINVSEDVFPYYKSVFLQMCITLSAMPWYCLFLAFLEYMVEHDWTKCYPRVSDVGWFAYAFYSTAYLIFLELTLYWMHRKLHDIKPLYKYLHSIHHMFNKQSTLSPFAGLATHPLDGILLGIPHMFALFLIPTHFRTHLVLIFLEGIWAANNHDGIYVQLWPIMGANYHILHHTTYRYNYGHYTIWMDWMFDTLLHPINEKAKIP